MNTSLVQSFTRLGAHYPAGKPKFDETEYRRHRKAKFIAQGLTATGKPRKRARSFGQSKGPNRNAWMREYRRKRNGGFKNCGAGI